MAAEKIGPPKQIAETDWKVWGIVLVDPAALNTEQTIIVPVPAAPPIKCVNCEE